MLPIALAAALPTKFGLQRGTPVALPECERMHLRYPERNGGKPPHLRVPRRRRGRWFRIRGYEPDDAVPSRKDAVDCRQHLDGHGGLRRQSRSDAGVDELRFRSVVIPAKRAKWLMPSYRLEYRAIQSEIDSGALNIETDKARAAREASNEALLAGRTRL